MLCDKIDRGMFLCSGRLFFCIQYTLSLYRTYLCGMRRGQIFVTVFSASLSFLWGKSVTFHIVFKYVLIPGACRYVASHEMIEMISVGIQIVAKFR